MRRWFLTILVIPAVLFVTGCDPTIERAAYQECRGYGVFPTTMRFIEGPNHTGTWVKITCSNGKTAIREVK